MAVKKSDRFEVFKRDKFTCQYCGKKAPDIVLQVDHIHPVSKGGLDDITNLITSCRECNIGKSNRLLSDNEAIKKQQKQLEDLQDRREQLEMLMEWHKSLLDFESQTLTELANFWEGFIEGYQLNENGEKMLKSWIKRFSLDEILEAMRVSASQYLQFEVIDDETNESILTPESAAKAFRYIPRIIVNKKKMEDKPYLKDLYYIRGILRNRLRYINEHKSMKVMEDAVKNSVEVDCIRELAKVTTSWSDFLSELEQLAEKG